MTKRIIPPKLKLEVFVNEANEISIAQFNPHGWDRPKGINDPLVISIPEEDIETVISFLRDALAELRDIQAEEEEQASPPGRAPASPRPDKPVESVDWIVRGYRNEEEHGHYGPFDSALGAVEVGNEVLLENTVHEIVIYHRRFGIREFLRFSDPIPLDDVIETAKRLEMQALQPSQPQQYLEN